MIQFSEVTKFSYLFSRRIERNIIAQKADPPLLAGSVSRYEALPMSDLDIVAFGDKDISIKPPSNIDRLDVLTIPDYSSAEQLLTRQSPEAGFLDCRTTNGDDGPYKHKFNENNRLLNRVLWDFIFSRRYNDRSCSDSINLKYSPGGYRDILILNLIARCIDYKTNLKQPEILRSLQIISKEFRIGKHELSTLESAIGTIMTFKSATLFATRNQPDRGRVNLDSHSVELFCSHFSGSLSDGVSASAALNIYKNAKLILDSFIRKIIKILYREFHSQFPKYLCSLYEQNLWIKELAVSDLSNSRELNNFPVAAALILETCLTENEQLSLASLIENDIGHNYTRRLLAKSPFSTKELLIYLLGQKFAIDGWTNLRYVELVKTRLKSL